MHQLFVKIRLFSLIISLIIGTVDSTALPVFQNIYHNSDTLGKYWKFEITVEMTANYVNPFDWDQVTLQGHFTSPSGDHIYVDGFYYQDFLLNEPDPVSPTDDPVWKIRFSPDEIGTWTYELICSDGTGTTYSGTYTFVCINSSVPGYISNANQYFQEFDDGTPFFPIGMSIPWNLGDGGFYTYETWMDSLAMNEANFVKIIMAPWSFGIEWDNTGLGNYTDRLNVAFWIDRLLNKAETEEMYLQLCLLVHNEISSESSNEWASSPYNIQNGGPCNNTWDFFTNSEAERFYKRRIRYINARWGYSPYLSSWELLSETDNTGDFDDHRSSINNWLIETADYIDSLDINNHLVSTSYAFFENDAEMWNNDVMDFTHIHRYNNSNDLELKLNAGTRQYLDDFGKPNIIGEFGLDHDPVLAGALDPNGISLHNSFWATSLSGSLGAAVAWHWDSYIDEQDLYYHFRPVSTFMHSIDDLNLLEYQPISVHTTSDVNLDLVIQPKFFTLFTPAPDDQFMVETTGNIDPRAEELSIMLYGYTFNSSRNPPHFNVNYTQEGQFAVKTTGNTLFSNIKIWIDGINVLNETAHSNSTYTVDVSLGEHIIFVENTGNFYIEVDSYLFYDYVPVCRSFALQDSTKIIGWLQNKNYNHEYINENGDPPPISGGLLEFENLHESYYEVEWWNCSTGLVDSTVIHTANDGILTLDSPPVVWDAAYKISYQSSIISPSYNASISNVCSGDTVTFTDASNGIIDSRSWQFPGGSPSSSTDANPSIVYQNKGSYDVTLTLYNQFDSATLVKSSYIDVDSIPEMPDEINGPAEVCQGPGPYNYMINPLPGVSSYLWTLPPGATGQSTSNQIQVTFGSSSQSGNLIVQAENDCGVSQSLSDYITVISPPEDAGMIEGLTQVCEGELDVYYAVSSIDHATGYVWSLPTGATGASSTNEILVSFPPGASSGTVSVYGTNMCDSGESSSIQITVNPLPGFTGTVYGDTLVCEGTEDLLYYIDPVPFANEYEWLLPYGVTGTSSTNEIYLSFPQAVACNIISVKGINTCGESNLAHIYVCVVALPEVLQQASDTIVNFFGNAAFTIEVGLGMSFQWQISTDNGISWDHLIDNNQYSGANQTSLLIFTCTSDMNGYQYRCLISNACEPSILSNPSVLTVVPGGWDYTITELVHTINVPLLANPSINDEPISPGDYIGIFYQDGESIKCGGTQQWNGSEGISLSVYGDDPLTEIKDGFASGEDFLWQIYSHVEDESYDAEASFIFGPDYYSSGAISTINDLNAIAYNNHVIEIPAGWSGISSHVIPENDTIHYLFDPFGNNLIVLMDIQNIFWPEQQIDQINNWDPYSGYKIKVDTATQLTITGLEETERTNTLQVGWSILPVLSDKNVSTIQTSIFSALGDTLQLAVEIAGSEIYWPSEDIITLTILRPGKAYMISVYEECMITFPEVTEEPRYLPPQAQPDIECPWNTFTFSPSSHCISLAPGILQSFQAGDVIAALNESGRCGGQIIVNHDRSNRSMILFGDDHTTPEIEGFTENDQIRFKLFRPTTEEIFELEAFYDIFLPAQGNFQTLGLSRLSALVFHPLDGKQVGSSTNIQLFPVPVDDFMSIHINSPLSSDHTLAIYNMDGQQMQKYSLHAHHTKLNLSTFAPGIYLIKISSRTDVYYKKILKK